MNNISKKWLLVAGGILILTLTSVTVFQHDLASRWKSLALKTTKELKSAQALLLEKDEIIADLQLKLETAEQRVTELTAEVVRLQNKVEAQKKTIEQLSGNIRKQHDRISLIQKEIERLDNNRQANEEKIARLTAERDKLLEQIEVKDRERQDVEAQMQQNERIAREQKEQIDDLNEGMAEDQARLEEVLEEAPPAADTPMMAPPLPKINESPSQDPEPAAAAAPGVNPEMAAKIQTSQQERLHRIMQGTSVRYASVTLKNDENGPELKKIKEDDWRYTFVDLELENPDPDVLLDEFFELQLIDLDNGTVVAMNERNRQYPDSEQASLGYRFKYTGKPVSIRYFNTETKSGKNYELRLKYAKPQPALHFLIPDGSLQIVADGKVTGR